MDIGNQRKMDLCCHSIKHHFMCHISSGDISIIAKSLIFDHLPFSHSSIFNITEHSCIYLSDLLTILS